MFLFIDNYDSFTYNLVQAFQCLGREITVRKNDDPEILDLALSPDLKAVCISPGPSHPRNAGLCMEFLSRLPAHIPVLGVCLGHQLLGYFAGAEVGRAPYVMHGKYSDIIHDGEGLFKGLPNPMRVARYHSLVVKVDENVEHPQFIVTARGPEGEVMALRYRDRPWVGVQFHPESILTPDGVELLKHFPDDIMPEDNRDRRMASILQELSEGKDLSADLASGGFSDLLDGKMTPAQIGAFLMGLRLKGESALELAHAVRIALGRARRVEGINGDCIDIVGTGGDGKSSFNCSTATALTLAGMGYRVIKHGNRAVSSKSGSADALEGLGFPLDISPADVPKLLEDRNFAFLFAPQFHPSFKKLGDTRRELGIRTLFNILGPLINPARPTHILLGVARRDLADTMADALLHSHIAKAALVYGAGGYDEVTPMGVNHIVLLNKGKKSVMELDPTAFGISPCLPEDVAVHSKEEALDVLKKLLRGEGPKAMLDMLTLNVGLALFILEDAWSIEVSMAKAKEAVYGGVGRRTLHVS